MKINMKCCNHALPWNIYLTWQPTQKIHLTCLALSSSFLTTSHLSVVWTTPLVCLMSIIPWCLSLRTIFRSSPDTCIHQVNYQSTLFKKGVNCSTGISMSIILCGRIDHHSGRNNKIKDSFNHFLATPTSCAGVQPWLLCVVKKNWLLCTTHWSYTI